MKFSTGCVMGCYVDRYFIEKADRRYLAQIEQEASDYEEWLEKIDPPKEET